MLNQVVAEAAPQIRREEPSEVVASSGDRPRLLTVLPYFLPRVGGVEHHAYQLASALERRGCSTTVLTQRLPGTPEHELLGETEVHRFGTTEKACGRREAYTQILRRVRHEPSANTVLYLCLSVGEEFCTELMLEILSAARRRGIPRIVRVPSSGRVTELAAADPAGLREVRAADRVIALNSGIRDELLRIGCDPARIVSLPNGVATERFRPAEEDVRERIRAQLGASPEDHVFFSPSRWAAKKRIPGLIGCWRQLAADAASRVKLWIVGDDRHEVGRGEVSRAVTAALVGVGADDVRLFGGRSHTEMVPFYQAADTYITLSTQEGQSNALLEAMACGLPVVAPETRAVTEVITDEVNGFLFEPGDPASALAAMRRCLEAPPAELAAMGERNRALIIRHHTVELMADRFERLLRTLLEER